LPFSAQQILGVPVPAQRLCAATSAIFGRGWQQLVDHARSRAFLSVDFYLEHSNCQALCDPLRNIKRFSSHADVGV
jgi:hypothetical protein